MNPEDPHWYSTVEAPVRSVGDTQKWDEQADVVVVGLGGATLLEYMPNSLQQIDVAAHLSS